MVHQVRGSLGGELALQVETVVEVIGWVEKDGVWQALHQEASQRTLVSNPGLLLHVSLQPCASFDFHATVFSLKLHDLTETLSTDDQDLHPRLLPFFL